MSAGHSPRDSMGYLPWWLLALVAVLFGLAALVVAGLAWWSRTADVPPAATVAPIVLTATPAPATATAAPPTPTPPPAEVTVTLPAPPAGDVKTGAYVQVFGTGDAGVLNLRAEPSLQAPVNYVALEREVLQVQAGPKQANGITWWYLVDTAASSRSGWAAQNYLQVVQGP
jgi:hypothetical protein